MGRPPRLARAAAALAVAVACVLLALTILDGGPPGDSAEPSSRPRSKQAPASAEPTHERADALAREPVGSEKAGAPLEPPPLTGRVYGEGEGALEGAEVLVAPAEYQAIEGTWSAEDFDVRLLTAADGSFRGGRPGFPYYRLLARHPGYVPVFLPDATAGDDLDIRLRRARTVRGVVLDAETGRPLPDVRLFIADLEPRGAAGHRVEVARTDRDGTFLADLPPGKTLLELTCQGRPPGLAYVEVPSPSDLVLRMGGRRPRGSWPWLKITADDTGEPVRGVTAREGTLVALDEGLYRIDPTSIPAATRTVSLTLEAPGMVTRLVYLDSEVTSGDSIAPPGIVEVRLRRTARVRLRPVDEQGKAVRDAKAWLWRYVRRRENGSVGYENVRGWASRPEPDGTLFLEIPPDTPCGLLVDAPGRRYVPVAVPALAPDSEKDLGEVALPPAHVVRGRVVGRAEGTPVPGATVLLTEEPEDTPWNPGASWLPNDFTSSAHPRRRLLARTDEEGRFSLEDVRAYAARLTVTAPGFAPAERRLTDDEMGQPLEVELGPAASIGGIVVRPDGTPAAGAGVVAVLLDRWRLDLGDSSARTWCDDHGAFRFDGLHPGSYDLYAWLGRASGRVNRVAAGTFDARIDLRQESRVVVQVLSAEDGRPVGMIRGQVASPRGAWQFTQESATGIYECRAPEGSPLWIDVKAPGFIGRRVLADPPAPGEMRFVEVRLERGRTALAGTIRFPDGRPVQGAALYLRQKQLAWRMVDWTNQAETDAFGRFRFQHALPDVDYVLEAEWTWRSGGGATCVLPLLLEPDSFRLSAGEERDVEITASLPPGSRVTGSVDVRWVFHRQTIGEETPRAAVAVTLESRERGGAHDLTLTATCAPGGSFVFPSVPAGEYDVHVDVDANVPGTYSYGPCEEREESLRVDGTSDSTLPLCMEVHIY